MINVITLFAAECKSGGFFGLNPWYQYINDKDHFNRCEITNFKFLPPHSDVPLVLLAVIDDLLRIAGIVAVAFVIVGAIGLITSQGNPEDASKAQSTVINALIGLVVSIVAVAFVAFIGKQLGG